jgi:release factor glutamine methyltransferase
VIAAARAAAERLEAAGCDTPRLDAELLLAHALGTDRTGLVTRGDDPLTAEQTQRFDALVERRAGREPVAYILGRRGFRYLDLEVDPRVLIPRPDTETIVEQAVARLRFGGIVHDVGTGSGAIALALADERPDLTVSASDASPDAVAVARANAERLGLDVPVELADGLPDAVAGGIAEGDYDMVVANLPYVREDEWDGLEPEIREHEPRMALVSGPDGLDAIRALVDQVPPGILIALEHAPAQAGAVRGLLRSATSVRDLAGRERVTVGLVP